jgi:hypothetical protein
VSVFVELQLKRLMNKIDAISCFIVCQKITPNEKGLALLGN